MVSRAKTESIPIQCKKRRNVIFFGEKIFPVEFGGLQVFEDSGAGAGKKNMQKSREKVWRERKKVYLCNPVREMGVRERPRGVPGWTWKDH